MFRAARRRERGQRAQKRRERKLPGALDASRIVEELSYHERDTPRLGQRPAHERACDGALFRALFRQRATHLDLELLRDRAEDGRVQPLLAREVVDHARERQPRLLRDVAHAGAVEATRREELLRAAHDPVARDLSLRRVATFRGAHEKRYERTG
jgi:hypothetical protein